MQQQDFRAQLDMFRNREVQIGAVVGLIVGLILGWFVLGWWLAPVQWVDAQPSDLHPRWQEHYVAMVVDSYLLSGDSQIARARLEGFDQAMLESLLGAVEARFEAQGATRQAQGVRQLADLLGVTVVSPETPAAVVAVATEPAVAGTVAPSEAAAPAPPEEKTQGPSTVQRVARVLALALIAMLVIIGGVAGIVWLQRRGVQFQVDEGAIEQAITQGGDERRIESMGLGERVTVQYRGEGPTFERAYQIYRENEPLPIGECGLRAVPTLSDNGRVVACAAWLYQREFPERAADTRVLASRHVYQNSVLRESLVASAQEAGKVILAEPGQTVHLEHETLEMTLRVMEVEYDDPDQQYISRLIVEIEPAMKHLESEEPPTTWVIKG